jgi:hypothetical protein
MYCLLCSSNHQAEYSAEMMIHFPGKNRERPGVLLFPKILICLDCGFSQFAAPKAELASLSTDRPSAESSTQGEDR